MCEKRYVWIAMMAYLVAGGLHISSQAQGPARGANDQVPAEVVEPAPDRPENEPIEPLPPPSDDVMRPTRLGFRLTPNMARWGARQWIKEEKESLDLSDDQADKLAERVGRQAMRFAHQNARGGRDLLEMLAESEFGSPAGGKLAPERKEDFGRRLADMIPQLRQFFKDISVDARPLLTDEQWEKWKEDLAEDLRDLYRLEADARRWAEGKAGEHEQISDLGEEKDPDRDREPGESERKKTRPVDRALRRARRDLEKMRNDDSGRFMKNAGRFFNFKPEQIQRAQQLLTDLQDRKRSIQTREWRDAVIRNRIKHYLRWFQPVSDIAPWEHLLETEYQTLIDPWKNAQAEFKSAVIDLATPEQRDAALADVRERAIEHGMTEAEINNLLAGRFQP